MTLYDRMKKYESVSQNHLMQNTPVIVRIDGRAFHTFTKGLDKPFDKILMKTMADTTEELCKNIQGCILAYSQSDEISLLLSDYHSIESEMFFAGNIQKISSVVASMATLYFNMFWYNHSTKYMSNYSKDFDAEDYKTSTYFETLNKKIFSATFDARVFNIPENEIVNYFYFRQKDAIRNSVAALAHRWIANKEIMHKSVDELKIILDDSGHSWNKLSIAEQRGIICKKDINEKWSIDENIPLFNNDREYIEKIALSCL